MSILSLEISGFFFILGYEIVYFFCEKTIEMGKNKFSRGIISILGIFLISGRVAGVDVCSQENQCEERAQCNDGIISPSEQCDDAVADKSCSSLGKGYLGGKYSCEGCRIDTSTCYFNICGNTIIEGDEECDEISTNGLTCQSFGFGGGVLDCTGTCKIDTSRCTETSLCGNGVVDPGEVCDDGDENGTPCTTNKCAYCSNQCTIITVGGNGNSGISIGASSKRSSIGGENVEISNNQTGDNDKLGDDLEFQGTTSDSPSSQSEFGNDQTMGTSSGKADAGTSKEQSPSSASNDDPASWVIPDELLDTGPWLDHVDSGAKTLTELSCDEDTYILYRYSRLTMEDLVTISDVPPMYILKFLRGDKRAIDSFIASIKSIESEDNKNDRIRFIVCKIEQFKEKSGLKHQHIGFSSGLGYVNYLLQYIQDHVILIFSLK